MFSILGSAECKSIIVGHTNSANFRCLFCRRCGQSSQFSLNSLYGLSRSPLSLYIFIIVFVIDIVNGENTETRSVLRIWKWRHYRKHASPWKGCLFWNFLRYVKNL